MRHHHPSLSSAQVAQVSGFQLVQLPCRAFQRVLRSAPVFYVPSPAFQVFRLPCGCFLWVHYSGVRFVSGLPF